MNTKQAVPPPPAPAGMTVRDVYYVIFRHKWLILLLTVLAVGASLAVRFAWPVPYNSEAKLLIKWVETSRPLGQSSPDVKFTTLDDRGANIINAEVAILTSADVITQVVDIVGVAKILGHPAAVSNRVDAGALTDRVEAADFVRRHLIPDVVKDSDIISLVFIHPNPEMPQQVLSHLVDVYEKRHKEIHLPDDQDYLRQKIDEIENGTLKDTEKELREAKRNVNITSLTASMAEAGSATAKLESEIREAQAELAAEQSIVKDRQALSPPAVASPTTGGAAGSTNQAPTFPQGVIKEYQRNSALLASLQAKEQELLGTYTAKNVLVQNIQSQIAETEEKGKDLEAQHPGISAFKPVAATTAAGGGGPVVDPRAALNEEIIKEHALAVKYQVLTNQLAQEQNRSDTISGSEGKIIELQRKQELLEKQLAYYHQTLDDAQASQASGPGNSSISMVESPTLPSRDMKKVIKASNLALLAGLALALTLPFLIEFYLDQSLKRASDIQTKLGVPSFITFPKMKLNTKRRAVNGAKKIQLLEAGEAAATNGAPAAEGAPAAAPAPALKANGEVSPWDQDHALHPFFETLRDRLMTYFEMINLTHKPKLVAVTSCSAHAGVTTTAAGLASSLSETGEGNVLLVDMNVRDGEAHHFYKGKLTCPLEEVIEQGTRSDALVKGNLYVAQDSDAPDTLPRVLPKRFSHLVPKMRASDYDYIIFDMPPISQISITPRLARFMDMVLLVVEAGKTDRETAKLATTLLTDAKTNVGVVMNKSREYLPRRLQQDI